MLSRVLKAKHGRHQSREEEVRFLKLYSMWHETHDLSLRKRLLTRLNVVMRRIPDFDLRSRFDQAF